MPGSPDIPGTKGWAVRWIGAQRDVLGGDVSGKADLRAFTGVPHLYALGPLEGAQGEVSIFDSVSSVARVVDGAIRVESSFDHRACFLVYATVPAWDNAVSAGAIRGIRALEALVVSAATRLQISLTEPIPFWVTGIAERLTFHVLDKRDGLPHTPELHERAKVRFVLTERPVELIGFFSTRHRGIFTPKDDNLHLHIKTLDDEVSGHLEEIELAAGATLWLPAGQREEEQRS